MKHKKNTRIWSGEKKLRAASYASLGVLGLVALLALCPVSSSSTHAETVDVSLNYGSVISVAVDPAVNMKVGIAAEEFTSGTANLTVATNNPTGYSIFMAPATDNETSLVSTKVPDEKVPSITADTLGSDMTGNVWGYALGAEDASESLTYHAIPKNNNSPIRDTDGPSSGSGDKYKLGFGAHVDTSLRPGTYTNQVVISALAYYVPPAMPNGITTMQEMTSSICSQMTDGQEYRLTDTRDGKSYYVAKLKDNYCWMTQNLAYEFKQFNDDGSQRYLTPEDSNVDEDWAIPADALEIGTKTSTTGDDRYDSTDMWIGDDGDKSGHARYGNYYTWGAATAGSGKGKASGNAIYSICPKGWRLPFSVNGSSAYLDSFKTLANAYGLYKTEDYSSGGSTYSLTLQSDPIFFVKAGYINPNDGSVTNRGATGYYLSASTADNKYDAYSLQLSNQQFFMYRSVSRSQGYSVRCLSR